MPHDPWQQVFELHWLTDQQLIDQAYIPFNFTWIPLVLKKWLRVLLEVSLSIKRAGFNAIPLFIAV